MGVVSVQAIVLVFSILPAASRASRFMDHSFLGLHARQADSCGGDQTLSTCGNGRPSNWCCPTGTQCLSLNNTGVQAVLCCPSGSACTAVQTISCDTSLQDASKFPKSSLHISNLSITLPRCGSTCCPVGFDCQISNGQSFCQAQEKTYQAQSSSIQSSTTVKSTSTVTTNSSASASASNAQSQSSLSKRLSSGVVAAIVIPILIAVVVMAILIFLCCRKAKNRRVISDPILDPQMAARSDFLGRRSPQLSLSQRVSPMSGTLIHPGTPDSVRSLAPSEEKFLTAPLRQLGSRPLPKAPTTGSPEMRNRNAPGVHFADQMSQSSSFRVLPQPPRERSPIKGTMTSQHPSGLYTLPNLRYQPPG